MPPLFGTELTVYDSRDPSGPHPPAPPEAFDVVGSVVAELMEMEQKFRNSVRQQKAAFSKTRFRAEKSDPLIVAQINLESNIAAVDKDKEADLRVDPKIRAKKEDVSNSQPPKYQPTTKPTGTESYSTCSTMEVQLSASTKKRACTSREDNEKEIHPNTLEGNKSMIQATEPESRVATEDTTLSPDGSSDCKESDHGSSKRNPPKFSSNGDGSEQEYTEPETEATGNPKRKASEIESESGPSFSGEVPDEGERLKKMRPHARVNSWKATVLQ